MQRDLVKTVRVIPVLIHILNPKGELDMVAPVGVEDAMRHLVALMDQGKAEMEGMEPSLYVIVYKECVCS